MKELREKSVLTQPELAEKVGVSPTTVSYWETGRRRPRIPHIRKLAEVLGVTTDEIRQAIQETKERTHEAA